MFLMAQSKLTSVRVSLIRFSPGREKLILKGRVGWRTLPAKMRE
jgi:hypothetical protein